LIVEIKISKAEWLMNQTESDRDIIALVIIKTTFKFYSREGA